MAFFLLAAPSAPAADPPAAAAARPVVSLKDLVRDAIRGNLALASARASSRGVETDVLAARGIFDPLLQAAPAYSSGSSTLLLEPGASTSGSQSGRFLGLGVSGTLPFSTSYALVLDHSWQDQDNPALAAPGELQPSAATALTLTLRQPLLKGAGARYAGAPLIRARLASQSADERLNRTLEQTIADVESAYWSLGLAEEVERLSRDSFLRAEELLNRNQRMRSLELISDVDLITSRRGAQARLTSLTEASRRRQDAADQLLFFVYGERGDAMATRLETLATEPPPAAAPELIGPAEVDSLAASLRSDVQALQLEVQQGALSEKVAHNSLLPDLSLAGSVATRTQATDSFRLFSNGRAGDLDSSDWRIGVTFSFPLSNRAARAAYQQSVWESQFRSLALASAQTNVRSEVRIAARAVTAHSLRLEQAQLSFDLARQQYEAGQKQLQLGLIDSFRLLQMEEEVTGAEVILAQVRYDRAQAITSYDLAIGTLREKYAEP
ncbi:MAG: TolC family protein [Deltaproteobacteria bacterium]|nr:TolC family protein [Deltaproteobacteria bacterium]